MATDQLQTSSSTSGTQTTTQSPQSTGTTPTGALSGSVQPGTATALLNGTSGVLLHDQALPTISLGTVTAAVPQPTAAPHKHLNGPLFGVSILLFVVAGVLFWTTSRSSVKTTT